MEKKKINLPKKDAGRKLADRLEKLSQKKPPKSLIDKINQNNLKKIAITKLRQELDI